MYVMDRKKLTKMLKNTKQLPKLLKERRHDQVHLQEELQKKAEEARKKLEASQPSAAAPAPAAPAAKK